MRIISFLFVSYNTNEATNFLPSLERESLNTSILMNSFDVPFSISFKTNRRCSQKPTIFHQATIFNNPVRKKNNSNPFISIFGTKMSPVLFFAHDHLPKRNLFSFAWHKEWNVLLENLILLMFCSVGLLCQIGYKEAGKLDYKVRLISSLRVAAAAAAAFRMKGAEKRDCQKEGLLSS